MSTRRTISSPGHRSGARARRLLSTLAISVLLSCRGEEGSVPDDAAEGESAPAEAAVDWPCEAKGYPCTWEEVSAETTERTFALADQALDRFEAGKAAELVEWLEAQPSVAEAQIEEATIVWFRLDGGRSIYVQVHAPLPAGFYGPGGNDTSQRGKPPLVYASIGNLIELPLRAFNELRNLRAPALAIPGVTGRDRNRDRRVNQRDHRRALILEPHRWEHCYLELEVYWINIENIPPAQRDRMLSERREAAQAVCDGERSTGHLGGIDSRQGIPDPGYNYVSEGAKVKAILEAIPAYRGNVTHLVNEQVDYRAFEGWSEYDVIHITSHGSRNMISIGQNIRWPGRGRLEGPAAKRRGLAPWVATTGGIEGAPRKRVWAADSRFFRSLNPKSVERALIFVNACGTLGHPDQPMTPISRTLSGKGSMYIGWGEQSQIMLYAHVASEFYALLAEGWSGAEAIRRLPEAFGGNYGDPVYAFSPGVYPGTEEAPDEFPAGKDVQQVLDEKMLEKGRVLGWRGSDMRIREVARLHPPTTIAGERGRQLMDGDDLEQVVAGELDDDVNDFLRLAVEVDAILEDERGETRVQLELDGKAIGEPRTLSDAKSVEQKRRHGWAEAESTVWRLEFDQVPVGKDLKPEEEYELEAVVSLPEGGESRYAAKLKGEPCSVYINGEFEGQLGGGHAQVFERGRNTQAKIFLNEGGAVMPGFRLPQQFELDQRGGGRNGWTFNFNAVLDGPVVPGARFRVERHDLMDPSIPQVGGSYRASRGEDAMSYPLGSANIMIHRVRWLDIDERATRRGMACGEVEANIQGLVPGTYPFQFVPHTFRAKFWAEIRRD